ncbi:hypothetical protein OIE53_21165 [Micromonospora sp. NBC_01739]|nr:hypothetical protein OIE53_21165 [Micromonospora sp. NBC_01739]
MLSPPERGDGRLLVVPLHRLTDVVQHPGQLRERPPTFGFQRPERRLRADDLGDQQRDRAADQRVVEAGRLQFPARRHHGDQEERGGGQLVADHAGGAGGDRQPGRGQDDHEDGGGGAGAEHPDDDLTEDHADGDTGQNPHGLPQPYTPGLRQDDQRGGPPNEHPPGRPDRRH